MVALALRMDAVKHVSGFLSSASQSSPSTRPGPSFLAALLPARQKQTSDSSPLTEQDAPGVMAERGYFGGCLGGYVVGYAFTAVAVNLMNLAQPALLYLVPGVLAGVLARGLQQEEVGQLWEFEDKRRDAAEKEGRGVG